MGSNRDLWGIYGGFYAGLNVLENFEQSLYLVMFLLVFYVHGQQLFMSLDRPDKSPIFGDTVVPDVT